MAHTSLPRHGAIHQRLIYRSCGQLLYMVGIQLLYKLCGKNLTLHNSIEYLLYSTHCVYLSTRFTLRNEAITTQNDRHASYHYFDDFLKFTKIGETDMSILDRLRKRPTIFHTSEHFTRQMQYLKHRTTASRVQINLHQYTRHEAARRGRSGSYCVTLEDIFTPTLDAHPPQRLAIHQV